jgi:hypothetical protein
MYMDFLEDTLNYKLFPAPNKYFSINEAFHAEAV